MVFMLIIVPLRFCVVYTVDAFRTLLLCDFFPGNLCFLTIQVLLRSYRQTPQLQDVAEFNNQYLLIFGCGVCRQRNRHTVRRMGRQNERIRCRDGLFL